MTSTHALLSRKREIRGPAVSLKEDSTKKNGACNIGHCVKSGASASSLIRLHKWKVCWLDYPPVESIIPPIRPPPFWRVNNAGAGAAPARLKGENVASSTRPLISLKKIWSEIYAFNVDSIGSLDQIFFSLQLHSYILNKFLLWRNL